MKLWRVVCLCVLLGGCSGGTLSLQPAPTPRPTLTGIEVYLGEVGDHLESMFVYNDDLNSRLTAEQQNPSLLTDTTWRSAVSQDLNGLRKEYSTIQNAPLPDGTADYHAAVIAAEAHTDHAAALLLGWLDTRDNAAYQQAMQELDAAKTARAAANKMLDTLLKK